MTWPLHLFMFSIVFVFVWIVLIRRANKTDAARYLVLANFAIYLIYTFYLIKPFFDDESGRGGGAFAAEMYIMLMTPLHLLLVFAALLVFEKSGKVKWMQNVLLFAALPGAAIAFGYLLSEHQRDVKERKQQQYFEEIHKSLEQEKLLNYKKHEKFESFLNRFSSDSTYQRDHANIPLPIYYLAPDLQTDTVDHYYQHNFPYLFKESRSGIFIYDDWEIAKKKSDKRKVVIYENGWRSEYNFRLTNKGWELFELIRRQ